MIYRVLVLKRWNESSVRAAYMICDEGVQCGNFVDSDADLTFRSGQETV